MPRNNSSLKPIESKEDVTLTSSEVSYAVASPSLSWTKEENKIREDPKRESGGDCKKKNKRRKVGKRKRRKERKRERYSLWRIEHFYPPFFLSFLHSFHSSQMVIDCKPQKKKKRKIRTFWVKIAVNQCALCRWLSFFHHLCFSNFGCFMFVCLSFFCFVRVVYVKYSFVWCFFSLSERETERHTETVRPKRQN